MANNQSGGGDQKKKGISDMILNSMKSRSGRETTKWINNLTDEGAQEIGEAVKAPIHSALPAQFAHPSIAQTQMTWVDRLFDLLQQYEAEFNRAMQIADLKVETERPLLTPDLMTKLQSNDQYHYSGRVHTRFWTLAVLGNLSYIRAYMIPSDHYIGFENNRSAYNLCFEFTPVWDGELKWSFERGSIAYGQLPAMTKLIFGHLIKVAKGDIDSDVPFTYGLSAPALPPKPMGGPNLQSPSGGGSDFNQRTGLFEDGPSLQEQQPARRNNKPDSAGPSPGGAGVPPASTPATPGEVDLDTACDILSRSIGKELELLSKAGAKAFENHDFAEVERLMKRTSKIKTMRDKIVATIEEWKDELSED